MELIEILLSTKKSSGLKKVKAILEEEQIDDENYRFKEDIAIMDIKVGVL